MKRMMFSALAVLALAGCGEAGESSESNENLRDQAGAAIDETSLADAIGSAVNKEAVEAMARGAVDNAVQGVIREHLPVEEIAAARTVIDEEALARGLDDAIDEQALGAAAKGAVDRATDEAGLTR